MTDRKQVETSRRRLRAAAATLAVLITMGTTLGALPSAKAQTLSILYSFTGTTDGAGLRAGLILDQAGNLYGVTGGGGEFNWGTVFKVDTAGNETVLHSFNLSDGAFPNAALIMDKAGNLYGTTTEGGQFGFGTVFKLDPAGNLTLLHSFGGSKGDGQIPSASVLMDKTGRLYGTTAGGGEFGYGTVFEITRAGKEKVLHSFTQIGNNDVFPTAALLMDKSRALFGATSGGGTFGAGTVFQMEPGGKEKVLHSFTGDDGQQPFGTLITDKSGNLYGTTFRGTALGGGTVFKLDRAGNETVLYAFTGSDGDGENPAAGLLMDGAGNLYGTTFNGGSGFGTVFKIDPAGNETILHGFSGSGNDGQFPSSNLIMDATGNFYGTTSGGGTYGWGTVFKLIP